MAVTWPQRKPVTQGPTFREGEGGLGGDGRLPVAGGGDFRRIGEGLGPVGSDPFWLLIVRDFSSTRGTKPLL
jgi:hypothetical protein